ncbi:MAG: zf-TFIIB domain-containing protein [Planctomycetota bacterium]
MAVRCPDCKQTMLPLRVGTFEIQFCRLGCKGLWFDARELQQVDATHKGFDDVLAEALAASERMRPNHPFFCPRCAKPMHVQGYHDSGVFVENCYLCGGYFLTAGELKQIRDFGDSKGGEEYEAAKRKLLAYKPPAKSYLSPRYIVGTDFRADPSIGGFFAW